MYFVCKKCGRIQSNPVIVTPLIIISIKFCYNQALRYMRFWTSIKKEQTPQNQNNIPSIVPFGMNKIIEVLDTIAKA